MHQQQNSSAKATSAKSSSINHGMIQQFIILALGILTIAVFLTSCAAPETCSAYQEVETLN
ncbi:MAG: hypothetical protein O2818_07670 [Bacteroidetes bacterium]|nr:hypothetical protein [Bacteroidota bacterium]MDA1336748.1 hypothetical protein [Bacteroidota bacterium]